MAIYGKFKPSPKFRRAGDYGRTLMDGDLGEFFFDRNVKKSYYWYSKTQEAALNAMDEEPESIRAMIHEKDGATLGMRMAIQKIAGEYVAATKAKKMVRK